MSVTKPPFGSSTDLSEARDRLAGVAFEAIWERDLENDALRWDENLESIFGYRRDEVANHLGWWRERVHPDDRPRVEQTAADAIRGNARDGPTNTASAAKTALGPGWRRAASSSAMPRAGLGARSVR